MRSESGVCAGTSLIRFGRLTIGAPSTKSQRYCENSVFASIVRNRAKIEGVILSARAYLEIEAKTGFSRYLWDFVDGAPIVNRPKHMSDVPAHTPLSERISKDLRARGFNFCGPMVVYAFMQAVGMVDDHLADCWRARE